MIVIQKPVFSGNVSHLLKQFPDFIMLRRFNFLRFQYKFTHTRQGTRIIFNFIIGFRRVHVQRRMRRSLSFQRFYFSGCSGASGYLECVIFLIILVHMIGLSVHSMECQCPSILSAKGAEVFR